MVNKDFQSSFSSIPALHKGSDCAEDTRASFFARVTSVRSAEGFRLDLLQLKELLSGFSCNARDMVSIGRSFSTANRQREGCTALLMNNVTYSSKASPLPLVTSIKKALVGIEVLLGVSYKNPDLLVIRSARTLSSTTQTRICRTRDSGIKALTHVEHQAVAIELTHCYGTCRIPMSFFQLSIERVYLTLSDFS